MSVFLAQPDRIGEGLQLAVKDLFDMAGLRTTHGSVLCADHVPARNAEAVARHPARGGARALRGSPGGMRRLPRLPGGHAAAGGSLHELPEPPADTATREALMRAFRDLRGPT
jgi:hypothetical protein